MNGLPSETRMGPIVDNNRHPVSARAGSNVASAFRNPRRVVPSISPPSVEIDPDVKCHYKGFYWLYELCNRVAWNRCLPPSILSFNYSAMPSNTAGFAERGLPPRICLNLRVCTRAKMASFLPVLLHEMTHVWQYSLGGLGGHGLDFRCELIRVGVDEKGQSPILPGSPAFSIMVTVQRQHPEIAGLFRSLVGHSPRNRLPMEVAIFHEYTASRELQSSAP